MAYFDNRNKSGDKACAGNVGEDNTGLIDLAGVGERIGFASNSEEAWIEVIRKMDEVYADHVRYQMQLEEKNTELEDAQKFIDSVLSAMTDILIVCDANGRIQRANTAFQDICGKLEDELVGHPLSDFFAEQSKSFLSKLPTKIHVNKHIEDREISIIDRHGNVSVIAMNCSPRFNHRGRLDGIVLIGRNLGELKKAYQELDQAHQKLRNTQQQLIFAEKMTALGRLVAGVAHELNNPISFVFGNMHALKRYGQRITKYLMAIEEMEDPEQLKILRTELKIDRILNDINPLVNGTLEGAERVSEIVQELRRFSSTQQKPLETFNLTRVISTATHWVVKSVQAYPSVHFDMKEKIEITGRRGPVHQIIVNLIQNAVDVTAEIENPQINISCKKHNNNVIITVEDNGPGINIKHIDQIFEPFFTTKPLGKGTGLGLYVSYGLAEEIGGKLMVENRKKGGAKFKFNLPIQS